MTANGPIDLRDHIRDIPDFPKPGILFKDITPLLADARAFQASVDALAEHFQGRGSTRWPPPRPAGSSSARPWRLRLGVGFIPIRKPGKLPYSKIGLEYALEYGTDRLEVHSDALGPGRRILLLDDVLATGGTMVACRDLVRMAGAEVVACAFVIELGFWEAAPGSGPRKSSA